MLKPDGLVGFHLANRYYALSPAVSATAASLGLAAALCENRPPAELAAELAVKASTWLAVGSSESVARLASQGWSAVRDGPILSDDFPDVMRLLRID